MEKSKVNNWHERRKKSRSASTDSLLSMDEGSDNSSGINMVPALPPKGRFLSTDNLSPPKLPPKHYTVSHTHTMYDFHDSTDIFGANFVMHICSMLQVCIMAIWFQGLLLNSGRS